MERRVLLLNKWYLPHRIIGWKSAIKLFYEDNADVIASYDEEIRSPSMTMKLPAVMRLHVPTRMLKNGVKFSRENVYTRDDYTCQYCIKPFPPRALSYDHVVPRAAGGQTTWENVVTCCKTCNAIKGNRSCDDAGMWPARTPARPKKLRLRAPDLAYEEAPEEWRAFLTPT